ncbi:MAG: hypothetical protein IJH34_10330 [Romboutsia sp.]|nr:hypothetical protein [Romboutsia sp.]
MVNDDTIKLLNECNAGVKMGVQGIKEVIDHAQDKELLNILVKYLDDHQKLGDKTHKYLNKFHDDGKEPNAMASAMSWVKINFKLLQSNVDEQIADVMVDGCNMGIKSISRYLNKYPAASQEIKNLVHDIIELEENFALDLRKFL